ncbi:HTH-type transcriptional repressor CytR [compost metagenome]
MNLNQPFDANYTFFECYHFEDGEEIVNRLQNMSQPPSALLISSDQVAAGILTCCKKENISIPNELAIMGFDNQPIAKMMNITTLEIPLVEVGRKLFLQAMDNTKISHEEIFVKLIERLTV